MINAGISQWGPLLFTAVVWGASGFALAEFIAFSRQPRVRRLHFAEFKRALPWAICLVVMQLAVISLRFIGSDYNNVSDFALMYLVFAVFSPALWSVGRIHAHRCGLPRTKVKWGAMAPFMILSILFVTGLLLSMMLVLLIPVRAGDAVRDLTNNASDMSLGILVIWLVINAPWQEELLFRHYLVPRLTNPGSQSQRSNAIKTSLAVIIAAAIFAIGHGANMVPAGPKLVQTFAWGLMLGWTRVTFGTIYAIGLHLAWNLAAPLIAPFIGN